MGGIMSNAAIAIDDQAAVTPTALSWKFIRWGAGQFDGLSRPPRCHSTITATSFDVSVARKRAGHCVVWWNRRRRTLGLLGCADDLPLSSCDELQAGNHDQYHMTMTGSAGTAAVELMSSAWPSRSPASGGRPYLLVPRAAH